MSGAMMDTDSPPWAADVELFVASDRLITDASRGDALRRIVTVLSAGELSFLELLRGMEGCLVTTDDARRARGVLLLAEAVAGYANGGGGGGGHNRGNATA
mmetsp:Transcript_35602/g.87585  ORF Transcript_35602/g.87585 Transcript_35602/m.87585 type:complete len:101 (+) Transcript_35602:23-325(+)